MKRLKHIISWTIWTLLALYVLALVSIRVPAVQGWIGSQLAGALGSRLGTEVSVGRVDLGFFNRIIIDRVDILDLQGEHLLTADRLTTRLKLLPLLDGRVSISSAQLFGLKARLYHLDDSLSTPNFQFIADALSTPGDTTRQSSFDLRINSLIIRNSSIAYDDTDVRDISAHIALKVLRPDSLNINIKRLAMEIRGERSEERGENEVLKLTRLTARLEANRRQALLSTFSLALPHSTLVADSVRATYDDPFTADGLQLDGRIDGSVIAPGDFAFLMPQLAKFQQTLHVDAAIEGRGRRFHLPRLSISTDDESLQLKARAALTDLGRHPHWRVGIETLNISSTMLSLLTTLGPDIPAATTELLSHVGDLRLTGDAEGLADGSMQAQGDLHTDLGSIVSRLSLNSGKQFTGVVTTDSLDLRRLLDNDRLGLIATSLNVSGSNQSLLAEGSIDRLDFGGYSYRNLSLDMAYRQGNASGRLLIDDPNLQAELEGDFEEFAATGHAQKHIRLTGRIAHIAPKTLNIADKWDDAVFRADIDADITGSTLNDLKGTVDIDDFVMQRPGNQTSALMSEPSPAATFALDNLHLKSGYDDDLHFLRMTGDFGEATLTGQFDWATLPQSFIGFIASKLPTLPGLPAKTVTSLNNFEADLRLNDSEWLQQLFGVPLTLHSPLHINALVNDETRQIDINGLLPSFSYGGSRYAGGQIDLTTLGDTAQCNIRVARLDDLGRRLNLNLTALAGDNNLSTTFSWDSHGDASGQMNAITQLYRNDSGKPEAHVRLLPSRISMKDATWQLEPSDMLYSDGLVVVDYFNLHHGDQHLVIDGVASHENGDTLMVDMHGLDVGYVLDLVNFHSVEFNGLATGRAYLTQLLGDKFNAWADLTVNNFHFLRGDMGTLRAQARWDADDKQIDIHAVADAGDNRLTLVDGYISPARSDIHLDIEAQNSPLTFIHSVTESFLGSIDGRARGHLLLSGPLGGMNLTGKMAVDATAFVTPLNTTYTLRGDTLRFLPNEMVFDNWRLHDRNQHVGLLSGGVHHRELKNFTFDFDVAADNLLAYDFPQFEDASTICGTVFATGHADIHGRPNEVTINCDVTPNANSFFAYNAANPDAVSNQQFITWRDKDPLTASPEGVPPSSPRGDAIDPTPDSKTTVVPSGAEGGASDLYINFRINATPDATLRVLMDQQTGDYITLNGSGTLRASFYNKGPFQMFGTYQVDRGTYGITIQQIIKKNFTFQEGGSIIFGGDPYDASLNLLAQYTVNGVSLSDLNIGNSFTNNTVRVNCLMNIQGTPGQPRVEFDLEMPTVNAEEQQMIRSIIASEQEMNQQVVYLLGIGRFYTQGANNAGQQQIGQTELAMQSFLSGTVSTQLNEVLSQVIKSSDWNFGANISTGNEGWHNAEYEGLVSGRMLNNRLLINGQFGYRDNATQATPSFIGDFDIRYVLTPNGNLALKVYNQTNDRYFTRSSLNTQGIGLILKRDFNGLGNLFHHRKKVKTAKK